MARCLKIGIQVVEGLYNLYSENKGADQLRSNRAADLRLCFHICIKQVTILYWIVLFRQQITKALIRLHSGAVQADLPISSLCLFKIRFSHVVTHL